MEDTRIKEATKQDKINADLIIADMQKETQANALHAKKSEGRSGGSKPKSP